MKTILWSLNNSPNVLPFFRAKRSAKDVVWSYGKIKTADSWKVPNICKQLLQDKVKYGKHRQLGAPPVPNCNQLFDISKCPSFVKGMAALDIKFEGCSCPTKQNLDGPDEPNIPA